MKKISFLVSSTNKVHISTEDDWTWCAYRLKSYKELDSFTDAPDVTVCKFCFDWFGHFAEFANILKKNK